MTLKFRYIMRSKKPNVFSRDETILKICRVKPNGLSTRILYSYAITNINNNIMYILLSSKVSNWINRNNQIRIHHTFI